MYGLSLVTAPVKEPISPAEAKRQLRLAEGVSQDEELIRGLITAARQYVETYTNRQLITATWDLVLDGFPRWYTDEILIPKAPLQSVTSVTYLDELGDSTVWTASEYRVLTSEPGRISLAYDIDEFPDLRGVAGQVTIRFVAGYGGNPEDVPMGLRQAILLHLQRLYDDTDVRLDQHRERSAHALMRQYCFGDEFMSYGQRRSL